MKNPIIRYGIYASLLLLVVFPISFIVGEGNYGLAEILGYAAITLSMIFVFLGIRQYREEIGGGSISFWQAVKVGLMIVLIPSVVFGLMDVIYITLINPEFAENYYQKTLEDMRATLSEADFAVKSAEMESQKALFMNPLMSFVLMALTVFLIGVVASVISAFTLNTSRS